MLIKGEQLNKYQLYRLLNPTMVHNCFRWHEGSNTDFIAFRAEGACMPGGLYFTTLPYLVDYLDINFLALDHFIADVELQANEPVWQECYSVCYTTHLKWKAHTVTLKKVRRLRDMPEQELFDFAKGHLDVSFDADEPEASWDQLLRRRRERPAVMALVPRPTARQIRNYFVEVFEPQSKHYENMSVEQLQWRLVAHHESFYLSYIGNQTVEMCVAAVLDDWRNYKFVDSRLLEQVLERLRSIKYPGLCTIEHDMRQIENGVKNKLINE